MRKERELETKAQKKTCRWEQKMNEPDVLLALSQRVDLEVEHSLGIPVRSLFLTESGTGTTKHVEICH